MKGLLFFPHSLNFWEMSMEENKPLHFKGKDAVEHVVEAQARGMIEKSEEHGVEIPGHLFSLADASRETALLFLLSWMVFSNYNIEAFFPLLTIACGWVIWKFGRAAWLGWSRLERLHRMMAEEKWEIDHHRAQEREELAALYEAKGFKGKLLEDVLDVLMADGDRLLRVMLEEEMGLSLEKQEHPLKQALGAAIGVIAAAIFCFIGLWLSPEYGMIVGAVLSVGIGAGIYAVYQRNRLIHATVWNISLLILAYGCSYFLLTS